MNDTGVVSASRSEECVVASDSGYSGSQAAQIVGISYRQLDYWARTDLVRPAILDAQGSGSRRHYSYRNLLELKVVKSLLDAGIKLASVREVFEFLRTNSDESISSAHLVISGSSVLLCRGEDLVDVVRNGQGVLNLLPLAQVKQDVDTQLVSLFPAAPVETTRDSSNHHRRIV